ncbi:Asp23/Gls24 family envelope stress response protein [Streptomyces sp. NPDC101225]|uniref:Asp23/Gls24 family envelope stress response protein n=1 Tax=Streptomyces sp. NPDC101225 TaxID=3366135 RepID=UPI0037F3E29C
MNARTDPPNSSSGQGGDDELLPCGRLLSQTWDAWERRTDDAHARFCPHCRQAVSGLDELESVVRGLRREAAGTSPYDPEPLTRRVMDVVRLELRPGRPLPLGDPTHGLWIMETVAARAVRAAAESVPGVRAGSCRLLSAGADQAVGVRLDIHAPAGAALPDIAARVRERVWEAADRELGMVIAVVDIRVTDVVPARADDEQEGRTP